MSLLQYLRGIGISFVGILLIVLGYLLAVDTAFKNNNLLVWFYVILIIVGFIVSLIGGYLVKTSYTQPIKIESPIKIETSKEIEREPIKVIKEIEVDDEDWEETEPKKVIICPKCKTENDLDSEFCKKCGNKLR